MAELVDTVRTVAWALAGWIVFLATVAAILVAAAAATGAWAVRGAWRWLSARLAASDASRAVPEGREPQKPSRARTRRPVPSWACTQPINYEEAAA